MKKMNKTYEAPVAELFEMQAPVTLVEISGGTVSGEGGEGNNPLIGG